MLSKLNHERFDRSPVSSDLPGLNVGRKVALEPQRSLSIDIAQAALGRHLRWLGETPAITSDPFDFKAHPWFVDKLATRKRLSSRIALYLAYCAFAIAPEYMRDLLKVERTQTAGAAAWLAQAYTELYRLSGKETHREIAQLWLRQLEQLHAEGSPGPTWGLPFDWQSLVLLPANCPLLYPTWQSVRAFYDFYRLTGHAASLEVCIAACRAMGSVFNRLIDNPRALCLSYSPHDHMQVYNINSLAGGLCCQVGASAGDAMISDLGFRMLNWVAGGQHAEGSWEYFSKQVDGGDVYTNKYIDHFHTAMTIQGFLDGLGVADERTWRKAVEAGLTFYLSRMFDASDRPKYFHSKTFPIDIMSCAEGILLFSRFQNEQCYGIDSMLRQRVVDRLDSLVRWSCVHLQAKEGYFYYRIYPFCRLTLCSYRWGQGAMLKALASYLNTV